MKTEAYPDYTGLEIAIVGMACRFPDAANWREYWDNLIQGKEALHRISDDELKAQGWDEESINRKDFVKVRATMKGKDTFDASFFGYGQYEAEVLNPIHRQFHECVWEALEDAGYVPSAVNGKISLYAGAGDDSNWKAHVMLGNQKRRQHDIALGFLSEKDHLTTLVSHKLNLQGPSFFINTACSSALSAVDLACKGLLMGEAKIAIAGGVSVNTRQKEGYFYEEGSIKSSDGHCRAFDTQASGSVGSEGVGAVVLKRLREAIDDGDHLYAVIKGSATNNDGNAKVGYAAPSMDGQVACIKKAQNIAGVKPESIGYVEAHGTGTRLGDPIEVGALNMAFGNTIHHSCAIGSVKSNIGHSDSAAGIAGLIKTALCLKYRKIPPSINYDRPNPEIDFEAGPFYVNTALTHWESDDHAPLRAAVSSFGVGGTNAHAILEEAPKPMESSLGKEFHLLTISAKSEKSLVDYKCRLAQFIKEEHEVNLADMCYTLLTGREHFEYRQHRVCTNKEDLIRFLEVANSKEQQKTQRKDKRPVVFMFPGQGTQYLNMSRKLYGSEWVFRQEMDEGFATIEKFTGKDFKKVLFTEDGIDNDINRTLYTQPIIFMMEYALAKLMMSYGIEPDLMIGHSLGEYVAACLSGVFALEDALWLMVKRGELMDGLERGSMVSASLTEEAAAPYLNEGVYLAAINSPSQLVFSGTPSAISALRAALDDTEVMHLTLRSSHAFHSGIQDPIKEKYHETVERVELHKPNIPFISSVTGEFIRDEEATSVLYWVRQMRETVQFSRSIATSVQEHENALFIEIGAGNTLTSLANEQMAHSQSPLNPVKGKRETINDGEFFANCLGNIWSEGIEVDWNRYYQQEKRTKVPLPTYAFAQTPYPVQVDPFTDFEKNAPNKETENKRNTPADSTGQVQHDSDFGKYQGTPTEETLRRIYQTFFGNENIGIDDEFLEIGGDSLNGMILVNTIRNDTEVELKLKDFFEKSTIRKLATLVDQIKISKVKKNLIERKTVKI